MKTKHFDINPVVVEWIDSMGGSGWHSKEDLDVDGDLNCVTVGLLVKKSKDRLTLCLNESKYQRGESIQIPLVAVKRIRKLNYG